MRSLLIAVFTCALPVATVADTTSMWDGTYARESSGGTELCPVSAAPVSVSGGKFSVVWNISVGGKPIAVGRIEGTASESGEVTPAVKLADPTPAVIVEMMRDSGDLNRLRWIAKDMKLVFRSMRSNRELRLSSGMCYASWTASPAPVAPAPAPPPAPAPDESAGDAPREPAPAPSKRAKATSKAKVKAPAKQAPATKIVAKPTKPTPAKASKPTPVRASSSGGSSMTSPRAPKPEPRTRGSANGASCGNDSDCESSNCEFRKCTSKDRMSKKLGNGFPCDYSSDCASGNCEFDKCVSKDRTRPELGTGADCSYASDCASGTCTFKKCVDD